MDDKGSRDTGRLAVALGVVAGGSAVLLLTFFIVGDPFGRINDVGNGATGVLSAILAWRLRSYVVGRAGEVAVGAAVVGAVITVVGSVLVISEATGYFLAGLVSSVGFAGIGAWLVILNRSSTVGSPRLRSLGLVSGALMSVGIVMVPGVVMRIDDMEAAPPWIWIGELGWLAIYLAYPIWSIRFGLAHQRLRDQSLR
jgi:hypothetical protein